MLTSSRTYFNLAWFSSQFLQQWREICPANRFNKSIAIVMSYFAIVAAAVVVVVVTGLLFCCCGRSSSTISYWLRFFLERHWDEVPRTQNDFRRWVRPASKKYLVLPAVNIKIGFWVQLSLELLQTSFTQIIYILIEKYVVDIFRSIKSPCDFVLWGKIASYAVIITYYIAFYYNFSAILLISKMADWHIRPGFPRVATRSAPPLRIVLIVYSLLQHVLRFIIKRYYASR